MNAEKEDFGIARLRQHLESAGVSSPEQIEMNIIESVTKYAATKVQHDDITLIVMQWKNKNMEK
jgi:serine phosphatase RsbU (regulator of sigma subunit)